MKLYEKCLLIDDVPGEKYPRYEIESFASPILLTEDLQIQKISPDDGTLLNKTTLGEHSFEYVDGESTTIDIIKNLTCVFSLNKKLHNGEIMVPLFEPNEETDYDKIFVEMLDLASENNKIYNNLNIALEELESNEVITKTLIVNENFDIEKFQNEKWHRGRDLDIYKSNLIAEGVVYCLPPSHFVGVKSQQLGKIGLAIINSYLVVKTVLN